jgi:hypothetical protein
LFDRRRGSHRRSGYPFTTLERVLELYRERYFDLNVWHFHEKLRDEHQIELSYSWVKGVLQGAGLIARGLTRSASQAATATAFAGHATAHRWQ